jgi:putative tryptophan/tyrosine transport system substrate-binding protein
MTRRREQEWTSRWHLAACIFGVALGLSGMAPEADAQPAAKVYRIGWLGHGSVPTANPGIGDFQQGLRDLGYVDGKNVVVEFRYASGNVDKLPELANEFSRLKVDVIVTSGEPAAFAAKRATSAIPIVATEFGLDPVKAGLVASLNRPGGNVTGLSSISEELWQKRLALLREFVPKLSRATVLWNPANPGNASCLTEIQAAARAMGMQLQSLEVGDGKALERAFAEITKSPPDAVVTCWDSVTLEYAKPIADFALMRRLPTLAPLKEYVQAGGLLSFGASLPAHRRRAAYYVDKIFKGAKPADLSVEQPTNFELVVNLATAKALGLALPPSVVVLADDLIQ